jgi:hypothetical protein
LYFDWTCDIACGLTVICRYAHEFGLSLIFRQPWQVFSIPLAFLHFPFCSFHGYLLVLLRQKMSVISRGRKAKNPFFDSIRSISFNAVIFLRILCRFCRRYASFSYVNYKPILPCSKFENNIRKYKKYLQF